MSHHAQHAQMFKLIHLERTVRSRLPGQAPRGLVDGITVAAADELGVGLDTIRRLRKWVRLCLAGRRNGIRRLAE